MRAWPAAPAGAAALAAVLAIAGPAAADRDLPVNALAGTPSAYLRAAAASPVAWQPWGPEAFRLAQRLDRPVLLSVGAGWCHWCHVMDREAYADPATATLINAHFVPIKVDRDLRPDVDARSQRAARAALGLSGWPLTLILTPAGEPVTGGATFLAEDRDGVPGLRPFLVRVLALRREHPAEFASAARAVLGLLAMPELSAGGLEPPGRIVDAIVEATLARFDPVHGGFGSEAKHIPGPVLALVLRRYAETADPRLREVLTRTLDVMAAGAIRDHLGGGFFRYTADRAWREPHWEKLDQVQAQMLLAYLGGYQATGTPAHRVAAEEVLGYVRRTLERPEGGFRAYQDADGAGGDAGHYLWSADQVRAAAPAEAELLIAHFGLTGSPGPLAVERPVERLATELSLPASAVRARLERGKARLREARARRGEPRVDDTVYADRNGLMVSAYLEVYRVLGDERARTVALRTLAFLDARLRQPDGGLAHALADGRAAGPGLLGDQLAVAAAHLDAFEVTGEAGHLEAARVLMRHALARFRAPGGGLVDRAPEPDEAGMGAPPDLFLDDDMPAARPLAALVLERLAGVTGDPDYLRQARDTVRAFSGAPSRLGPLAATQALALDTSLGPQIHAVIVGARDDQRTQALWRAALRAFRPGKTVMLVDPTAGEPGWLPAPVQAMRAQGVLADGAGAPAQVYVCSSRLCALPTADPVQVGTLVRAFERGRR